MYLSKLELNPRSREARRDLARPYELHRTLAHAFATPAGQDYRAAHGVLFRLESPPTGRPTLLVQSHAQPDWLALPAGYLGREAQSKPLDIALAAGQVLGFRLVAHPSKKVTAQGQRQGRRVALLDKATGHDQPTPAQQWLRRKAEAGGFELLHVLSEEFQLGSGAATAEAGKPQLLLYGVRFDGLLRVADPARLTEAVRQGVGPAKAFGCGLLSLARSVTG